MQTGNAAQLRPVIVLFHGGGRAWGSPEWVYDAAKHYASYGAVAVAAEYRLSDQKSITPLDAMADARAIVRWLRRNSKKLGIDPEHIAVYGVSAGGHIATSLATIEDPENSDVSSVPNAIVLVSGVVSTEEDGWVQQLLGNRGKSRDISPLAHVKKGLPPMIVFNGKLDTLTPLVRVARYCDRVKEAGRNMRTVRLRKRGAAVHAQAGPQGPTGGKLRSRS